MKRGGGQATDGRAGGAAAETVVGGWVGGLVGWKWDARRVGEKGGRWGRRVSCGGHVWLVV